MSSPIDLRPIEARIKLLLNAQLKGILKGQGLTVSGVKSELQIRLIARRASSFHSVPFTDVRNIDLNRLAAAQQFSRIQRIRYLVSGGDDFDSNNNNNEAVASSSPHKATTFSSPPNRLPTLSQPSPSPGASMATSSSLVHGTTLPSFICHGSRARHYR
jgi:hypothetical protein